MRPTRLRSIIGTTAAFVAISVGCSGSEEVSPPSSSTTTTVTPAPPSTTPDRSQGYLDALGDPTVEPSSVAVGPAVLYLEHRRRSEAVLQQASTVALGPTDASVRLCTDGQCAVLDVRALDPATGLVADVAIDGLMVGGRIAGNGPLDSAEGVGARVLTAYLTDEGRLVVTVELDNSAEVDVEIFPFAAVFRPSGSGAGVEASGSFGPSRLGAGATSTVVLVFDGPELSGRIGLRGILDDGLDLSLDIEIPEPVR